MKPKQKPPFDPKIFLDKVGQGKTIADYPEGWVVFSQGEPADSVFYIQKGKVKKTVISKSIFSSKDEPETVK